MARRRREPRTEAESAVIEALGKLMEFWGFRPALGRIWGLLYLSTEPVPAGAVVERLAMSTGAVSMGLQELQRWGVIRKVLVPGERREHFAAEADVWKLVSRVLREREFREIDTAERAFGAALVGLEGAQDAVIRARVEDLVDLAQAGKEMLGLLLSNESLEDALAHEQAGRRDSGVDGEPRGGAPATAGLLGPMPDFLGD